MPSLRISSGSQTGTSLPLTEGRYVIGRGSDADLVLHDQTASRRHSEIVVAGGDIRIRDLGSVNGTRVNGKKVADDAVLAPGDRVTIAKTHLVMAADQERGLRLFCHEGPTTGHAFPLAGERTVIGRDAECAIRIEDPAVAPLHAAISHDGTALRLHDLNSRTGTWLNGDRVSGATALSAGDEIVVGPATFELIDPEIHDLEPEALPGYTLSTRLGISSLGATYRARRHRSDEMVALKIFPPSVTRDPALKTRLLNAARRQARIEHDHLLPVIEVGEHEGYLLVATALAANGSLADLLDEDELPPPLVIAALLRDAARGLAAAAETGLHHGGLRPADILIDDEGLGMVGDLGLTAAATRHGDAGGEHPYYRAPEELAGDPVDERSDQYALGAVGYHALTGTPPYAEFEDEVAWDQVHTRQLPAIRDYNDGVPTPLERIVGRMLAPRREDRYPDLATVIADLEAVVRDGARATVHAGASASGVGHATGVQRHAVKRARGRGMRSRRRSRSELSRELDQIPSGIRSLLFIAVALVVFLFLFAIGRSLYLSYSDHNGAEQSATP